MKNLKGNPTMLESSSVLFLYVHLINSFRIQKVIKAEQLYWLSFVKFKSSSFFVELL